MRDYLQKRRLDIPSLPTGSPAVFLISKPHTRVLPISCRISGKGIVIDYIYWQLRESPLDQRSLVFGRKRELLAINSLLDVSTQIERISNLISSYVVEAPQGQLSEKHLLAGNPMRCEKE